MQMKDVICQKRKTLGLTQEQIAKRLGVSAPAVNKWESGVTCPDIALLPALARLLQTDLNTLFCFQKDLSKEDIAQILNEIAKIGRDPDLGGLEEAFQLTQKKAKEFPSNSELLYQLATVLNGLWMMVPCQESARKAYSAFSRKLYQQAIACGDPVFANKARYMLASEKIQNEELEGAMQLIERIPTDQSFGRDLLFISLYMKQKKHKEASELLEKKLSKSIQDTFLLLNQLATVAVREGDSARAQTLADYSAKLMEIYNWRFSSYTVAMSVAMEEKDADKCICLLEQMISSLTEENHMADSVLFAHAAKPASHFDSCQNLLKMLLGALESSNEFSFLRGKEEFQALIATYKKALGEPG